MVLVRKKGNTWRFCVDYRGLIAVTIRDSHPYQFKSMSIGLTNAPATFQRLIELVLKGLPWYICIVDLDDILTYSWSSEEDLSALEVFSQIGAADQQMKAREYNLARDHVVFLGHVISAEGLQTDPKNIEKVKSWPTPRLATEVRALLGLSSY